MSTTRCGICEESIKTLPDSDIYLEEVGEFVGTDGKHVIAHAQCGLDQGMELA